MYVKSPAIVAKNEYQSLVSPVVRRGGLSNSIQKPHINEAKTPTDRISKSIAHLRLPAKADTDATTEQAIAAQAKYMKLSQLIALDHE